MIRFISLKPKYILAVCLLYGITSCDDVSTKITFTKENITDRHLYKWNGDSTILVFSSNIQIPLTPVELKPGKYVITFKAEGAPAAGILPNLSISFGDLFIANKSITAGINPYVVKFEIQKQMLKSLQLAFTNDYSSPTEDRNIYLHFPIELKPY